MDPVLQAPSQTALEAVGTGVLEEIERFNRRHREIYSVLRGAVGAGARNFVATCMRRLGDAGPLFASLPMDETGAFSSAELFARIGGLEPSAIRRKLETLITAEVDFARAFLDERTVQTMFKRVEAVTTELAAERV